MHERDAAPIRGLMNGLWLGVTAWVCVVIVGCGLVSLWRAAPDLTTGDWLALGCSTTLAYMLAVPIARVIKRKVR